ncbi:polysaccharide deacetylase family protein [Pseudoflavonifractor phocaeensis]|uniref:polysaccharide deacetylase family protein n=1 Tax=Pseudoflavonifractor phocaeensis TaxID=1870988 RepID=UPI00210DB9F0|nr:polysaccharide deacetylase [Pseudoflavonifractor phocaeensis]
MRGRAPYWGSVRFFKHLILAALALLILAPSVGCVLLAVQRAELRSELERASLAAAPPSEPSAEPSPAPAVEVIPLPTEAEYPYYAYLHPELYAPPCRRGSVNRENTCYLTFDDGPSARTPEVLDILREYGVRATFFTVGKTDEQSRAWMRRIVEEGHTLGVHSYSHSYRDIYDSVEAFLDDFAAQYALILETTGEAPAVFRFPGGSINGYNAGLYQEVIAEMTRRGFVYVDWNVSGEDATANATEASILAGALAGTDKRRAFVLLHDSAPRYDTAAALPGIITAYREAGFTFEAFTPEIAPVIFPYQN